MIKRWWVSRGLRRKIHEVLWICEMGRTVEAAAVLRGLFVRRWEVES